MTQNSEPANAGFEGFEVIDTYTLKDALEDLKKIGPQDVLALIKIDLSRNPTRMQCALLPLDALKKAIARPIKRSHRAAGAATL